MIDLSIYEEHPTIHLIQSPVLYRLEDLPREPFANEVCNWAIQDQDDDWDFNEEFCDCDFVVGVVNVRAIAAEISHVISEMSKSREDWRWCYGNERTDFEAQHQSYMKKQIHPFAGDEAHDRWHNSKNPISLTAHHDDPEFPVLRDGWHRFHCAYANGVESLPAITQLYSLEPREYRKIWDFPWMT